MKKTFITLVLALVAVLPTMADGRADLSAISSIEGVQEVKLGKEMLQMAIASGMDMGEQMEGMSAEMLKNVNEMSIYLAQDATAAPVIDACVNELKANKSYETLASMQNQEGTVAIYAYPVEGGYDELLMFICTEETGAIVMQLLGQFTPEMLQELVKATANAEE